MGLKTPSSSFLDPIASFFTSLLPGSVKIVQKVNQLDKIETKFLFNQLDIMTLTVNNLRRSKYKVDLSHLLTSGLVS